MDFAFFYVIDAFLIELRCQFHGDCFLIPYRLPWIDRTLLDSVVWKHKSCVTRIGRLQQGPTKHEFITYLEDGLVERDIREMF